MNILRAVKTDLLRQGFGKENTVPSMLATYQAEGLLGHDGWDWGVKCKDNSAKIGGQCEQIYCDIDSKATITYIQKDVAGGYGIIAMDEDGDHKHLWWHFDIISPNLKVGDVIGAGDLLGVAGNTGLSTGAHLHRGLYSYAAGNNNGYHGAISPEPFFKDIFVLDYATLINVQKSILIKLIILLKQKLGL